MKCSREIIEAIKAVERALARHSELELWTGPELATAFTNLYKVCGVRRQSRESWSHFDGSYKAFTELDKIKMQLGIDPLQA